MLTRLDLTAANRPQLLPDETLLFVQSEVGLYEGKSKLPNYQNGFVYLTSHRACYVDSTHPKKYSVAVELRDVDRVEPYAGFIKSSPKAILHLRGCSPTASSDPSTPRPGTPAIRAATPPVSTGVWICSICSFSNLIPSNYYPGVTQASNIPPCLNCGVRPQPAHLDAALEQHSTRYRPSTASSERNDSVCPVCTFHNHPSLLNCEICTSPLRSPSPPPLPSSTSPPSSLEPQIIKFSFHVGGQGQFLSHLRSSLIQRKWLLETAPPIPRPPSPKLKLNHTSAGIGGLEQSTSLRRQKNTQTLGTAFTDLESLMSQAKELVALAESLSSVLSPGERLKSDIALGIAGKDQIGEDAWIDELARQVTEFLVGNGVFKREGGVMTLVDLWAVFNRARAGIDLVSPKDLEAAVDRFEELKLPLRVRRFGSGLVVVQECNKSDEETVNMIVAFMMEGSEGTGGGWGRGVSAKDCAERFGWSLGVATEELEMAEERGRVCREVGVWGVLFWRNWFCEDIGERGMGIVGRRG